MIVGVSQAFTGPVLAPLGVEGGGLHLRGPSSRGKTTILRVAVSVWGGPGLLQSWRATDNGHEGIAAGLNETICALDEIGEAPAKQVSEMVYMLANGAGKARAGKLGEALRQQEWRVPILSSGEMSVANKLAEVGMTARAGVEVRLLDLPAEIHAHGAFADLHGEATAEAFSHALKQAAASSHGVAGRAFVEALLQDRDAHLERLRALMKTFKEEARSRQAIGGEGQAERALNRFALIAAAGELASSLGVTGWPECAARDAAHTILRFWIEARGTEAAEKRAAITRVRGFIILEAVAAQRRWPRPAGTP